MAGLGENRSDGAAYIPGAPVTIRFIFVLHRLRIEPRF